MEATLGVIVCEVSVRLYWFRQKDFLETTEALVHVAMIGSITRLFKRAIRDANPNLCQLRRALPESNAWALSGRGGPSSGVTLPLAQIRS
jgi:hypothetical protein